MKTNSLETAWLQHYFTNAAIANVGDASGLQPSAGAGSLYLSLHTAYPGETGGQTTSECGYTGYARKAVTRSGAEWSITGNQAVNANAQAFPQKTAGTDETALFCGIGRSISGAGTLDYIAPLGSVLGDGTADVADNFTIPGLSGLSVNDLIAFFAVPGSSLPTGITAGTAYFTKTVSGAVITVSATSGGAAIDVTGAGAFAAWRITGLLISNLITPTIGAGQLSVLEE